MDRLTEKQQEFLKNVCMTTRYERDFYLSYTKWDENLDMMKDLVKLGYKFQSSMMGMDESVYYCWFEGKKIGYEENN